MSPALLEAFVFLDLLTTKEVLVYSDIRSVSILIQDSHETPNKSFVYLLL